MIFEIDDIFIDWMDPDDLDPEDLKYLSDMEDESSSEIEKEAGEGEFKYLQGINLRELHKTHQPNPEQGKKEFYSKLQEDATMGPIFSGETMGYILTLPSEIFPTHNRKEFIKWLANQYEQFYGIFKAMNINHNDIITIRDWFEATQPNLDSHEILGAIQTANQWHTTIKMEEDREYASHNVVYQFDNGFSIVKLAPEDCESEGAMMGHCVGGYASLIAEKGVEIYSLRDPNNKPHVTIDVERKYVVQIKGKQNKPPVEKYATMVKEWLKTTGFYYEESEDYIAIVDSDELHNLIDKKTVLPQNEDKYKDGDGTHYVNLVEKARRNYYFLEKLLSSPKLKLEHLIKILQFSLDRIFTLSYGAEQDLFRKLVNHPNFDQDLAFITLQKLLALDLSTFKNFNSALSLLKFMVKKDTLLDSGSFSYLEELINRMILVSDTLEQRRNIAMLLGRLIDDHNYEEIFARSFMSLVRQYSELRVGDTKSIFKELEERGF